MRQYLIDFLNELEQLIDPDKGKHHIIVSNTEEAGEQLTLTIVDRGMFFQYFLEESDFDLPPAQLAEDIEKLHGTRPERQVELGVSSDQPSRG